MSQQDQKVIAESEDVTRFFIIEDYGELSNYLNILKVFVLIVPTCTPLQPNYVCFFNN